VRPGILAPQLYDLLMVCDFAVMRALFTAFFASIPHDGYRNSPIAPYEGYYASIFYSYFAALGLDIRLEDTTNQSRIDMTVLLNAQAFLFEFKVVELIPDGKALQQLKDKSDADKYRAQGEPIHLIGVEFSQESRSVAGFEGKRAANPSCQVALGQLAVGTTQRWGNNSSKREFGQVGNLVSTSLR
jgi:hypothetical protein